MSSGNFSEKATTMLTSAGWFPGRTIAEQVERWADELRAWDGTEVSAAGRKVLLEFGGLHIRSPSKKHLDFNLVPTLAVGERDRLECFVDPEMGGLCALGEADEGRCYVCIYDSGAVMLVMDDAYAVADTFDLALEFLAHGAAW